MKLPYLEQIASDGDIGIVLEVHLVEVSDAHSIELTDGIHRFTILHLMPVFFVLGVSFLGFLGKEYVHASRQSEIFVHLVEFEQFLLGNLQRILGLFV